MGLKQVCSQGKESTRPPKSHRLLTHTLFISPLLPGFRVNLGQSPGPVTSVQCNE